MASVGAVIGQQPINTAPTREQIFTPQKAYPASIEQGARDYDSIMGAYKNILNTPYQSSPDVTSAMSGLKGLAETGGLSLADQAAIRERGISPVRAVYANAMRNLDRQRALQGGYSPNYTAATAKMSRDLSDEIANQTTNVNAQLAQMIQQGKLQAAPQYAQFASQEESKQQQRPLDILQRMNSLYGTTPANAALFGQQALQEQQIERTPIPIHQNSPGISTPTRPLGVNIPNPLLGRNATQANFTPDYSNYSTGVPTGAVTSDFMKALGYV